MLKGPLSWNTADALRALTERAAADAAREAAMASAEAGRRAAAQNERFLRQTLSHADVALLLARAASAAALGQTQVEILTFPSALLPDRGRRIIQNEPDWRDHLVGLAGQFADAFAAELAPLGYRLRAEIVTWPDGMPGDITISLGW